MISQIEGTVRRLLENRVELDVGGLTYEILLPSRAYQQIRRMDPDKPLRLFTFHYLEGGMAANPIPRLVGFVGELDREFFQLLRTVKNVGVKTALQSMILPVSDYARAIENEDIPTLKGLPEIGPATAKRIIAELKGKKLVKFMLLPSEGGEIEAGPMLADYKAEALEVLMQIGKSRYEAEAWVEGAAERFPDIRESERLLTEIFKLYGAPGG
jgi:Holliday junction DNA helicase RuvA